MRSESRCRRCARPRRASPKTAYLQCFERRLCLEKIADRLRSGDGGYHEIQMTQPCRRWRYTRHQIDQFIVAERAPQIVPGRSRRDPRGRGRILAQQGVPEECIQETHRAGRRAPGAQPADRRYAVRQGARRCNSARAHVRARHRPLERAAPTRATTSRRTCRAMRGRHGKPSRATMSPVSASWPRRKPAA